MSDPANVRTAADLLSSIQESAAANSTNRQFLRDVVASYDSAVSVEAATRALAAIPVVATTAARTALYPSPTANQRVQNLETGNIERWTGAAWYADFVASAVTFTNTVTLTKQLYATGNVPGASIYIKSAASAPCWIEFYKPDFTERGSVGALGNFEMNLSYNMDYTQTQHRFYDQTKAGLWLAMSGVGATLQYAPATAVAGDVWVAGGSLVNWNVDGPTGNETVRGSGTFGGNVSVVTAGNTQLELKSTGAGGKDWVVISKTTSGDFVIRETTAFGDIITIDGSLGNTTIAASLVVGVGALATNAAHGFLYIPSSAGAPVGTPWAYTGRMAIEYDSTNNFLYVYNGGWKKSTVYA